MTDQIAVDGYLASLNVLTDTSPVRQDGLSQQCIQNGLLVVCPVHECHGLYNPRYIWREV